MDLQSQLQDLLDLSTHVNVLLQKQSDILIRKRNLLSKPDEDELDENEDEDDALTLTYDIILASRSLQVLQIRREIRSVVGELMGVREQFDKLDEDSWIEYIQDLMEHLHLVLKKGLDLQICGSLPDSVTMQENRARSNLTRRHTMDSEEIPVARLFIGNLRFQKTPSKAGKTSLVSQEHFYAENHLTHIFNQESSEEASDEFVDAVESPEEEHDKKSSIKKSHARRTSEIQELAARTQSLMKRTSSLLSFPSTLDTVVEDDSHSLSEDNVTLSSFSLVPSALSTPTSTPNSCSPTESVFQIKLGRDKPTHLFAEEVTVGNPLRVGVGYGSYIVYTCTVKGQEGANIVARKRYSDFVQLRAQLIKAQPSYKRLIPKLPPKKVVGKFGAEFIETRRNDLEYFLTYVLLHPILGATPVVRRWFMSENGHFD
ncbi:11074_t:CDS:2 [Ambispora gerdemannii]|uniref:Endosomal/vacuolar adapter protein YPT35 n=1 Tax=Ambispora gerdemannii TaxID=144530 RepID=A0A9N8V3R6_9GLOM|nr:11074_t:CDS:2 [Ambispora gerdemannii]